VYQINLYFVEAYFTQPSQRTFTITFNGLNPLGNSSVDPYASCGLLAVCSIQLLWTASQNLVITFRAPSATSPGERIESTRLPGSG
jgi:hypothetical protein